MSEATFKRKFTAVYGQSPARYILNQKLLHAKKLLQIDSMLVVDIAYECGFSSPSSFNKAFKKHLGSTPSAFRQKQKDKDLS